MVSGLVNALVLVLVVFAGATRARHHRRRPARPGLRLGAARDAHHPVDQPAAALGSRPGRRDGDHRRRPARPHPRRRRARPRPAGCGRRPRSSWPSGWCAPCAAPRPAGPAGCCTRSSALVAVTAVGGTVESIALARDHGRFEMTGALYDVGGHRLHLDCTGTGSPTVVLENGLNEISPLWSAITAQVARTTRVCAYDRAGQGWSDDADGPQDGRRRRRRPAHPAGPRRRARPVRPGRALLRRHPRHDLRRPLPGAGRRAWCCSTRPARTSSPTSPTSPAPTR